MTSLIRYGHSRFGPTNAVLSIAIEHGFLAEEGIEVERKEYPRASVGIRAAVAGEVDAVTCPGVALLRAAMAGGDPVSVLNLEATNVLALIGARGVTSTDDLRGTTVGVAGALDQNGIVLRRALREAGLDPDEDVDLYDYGSRGAVWDALVRGEVSAMCATIPQPLLARKLGLPVLRDFHATPEPYQCGTVVTTRRFIRQQPDLLRRFLTGLRKGIRLFQSDAPIALPHLKARTKLDDEDVLRQTHALFAEAMDDDVPSRAPLEAVARDLEHATGTPVGVDLSTLIDTTFAITGRPRGGASQRGSDQR